MRHSGFVSVSGISNNRLTQIQILAVNEFESDRKRMSILIKIFGDSSAGDSKDRLVLLCKGADTSMLPRCKPGDTTSQVLHNDFRRSIILSFLANYLLLPLFCLPLPVFMTYV